MHCKSSNFELTSNFEFYSCFNRIDITIRIKCLRAVWNRPTEEQAAKLCELVKQGIKKHWEVDILDNAGKAE